MGPRGDIPNPQGSEYCVSLPWSPEPRTLNLWASKGVWGRSPQIAGSAGNCAAYLL